MKDLPKRYTSVHQSLSPYLPGPGGLAVASDNIQSQLLSPCDPLLQSIQNITFANQPTGIDTKPGLLYKCLPID